MLKIHQIKQTFIKQLSEDGCGPACLAMILKYTGNSNAAMEVASVKPTQGGLSLHELKTLSSDYGLPARCVKLEMDFLKRVGAPVILHTVNELGNTHYQICYEFRRGRFLMADPAIQVHWLREADLAEKWVSRAAVYYGELKFDAGSPKRSMLFELLRQGSFPPGLLITIPLLSLSVAALGIALTWLLQRGLTDSRIFQRHVICSLILLLAVISLFRNLFSFLRQYIIIKMNVNTNDRLMNRLFVKLQNISARNAAINEGEVNYHFVNIQRIQNAISVFISVVLCDGCMLTILLCSSAYILPLSGVCNLISMAGLLVWQIKLVPGRIYTMQRTRLLSKAAEAATADHLNRKAGQRLPGASQQGFKSLYRLNLQAAEDFAFNLSVTQLLLESLGTINMLIIITYAVWCFEAQEIDYVSFMFVSIEAYLIGALMQKICTSFQDIAEGTDAFIAQFS